jgi:excisionase family DNA binding protein
MASISVREAAKRFNVSRPTVVKRLKNGTISGKPQDGGGWLIDPAELIRAGYTARTEPVNTGEPQPVKVTAIAPPDPDEMVKLKAALAAAEARAAVAEALADERAAHIADFRRMLPAPTEKSGWWPFKR